MVASMVRFGWKMCVDQIETVWVILSVRSYHYHATVAF